MSEYQKIKARAQALQREKEEALKRELAEKAEKDKQQARNEEEKRKRREAQAKEARRLELVRANEELLRHQQAATAGRSEGRMDYNPFAEDERRPATTTDGSSKLAASAVKSKPRRPSNVRAESPRPGPSKPSLSTAKDRASPPPLGRKEKAVKAFMQSAKKPSAAESIFSIRALVDARNGRSSSSPSASAFSTPRMALPSKQRPSTKHQMKMQASAEGLRKLCPDRMTRDRRTIDQIHKDIKARKGGDEVPAKRLRSVSPHKQLSPGKMRVKPKLQPIPTTARPAGPIRPNGASRPFPSNRRHASSSPSTSSSSVSPPPRNKRPRNFSPALNVSNQAVISAEIQALFRRPGLPGPRTYAHSEGSSDMEAGMSDVEAEERRTARIARREDEEAEREEMKRKLAKEMAKKDRMKVKA